MTLNLFKNVALKCIKNCTHPLFYLGMVSRISSFSNIWLVVYVFGANYPSTDFFGLCFFNSISHTSFINFYCSLFLLFSSYSPTYKNTYSRVVMLIPYSAIFSSFFFYSMELNNDAKTFTSSKGICNETSDEIFVKTLA